MNDKLVPLAAAFLKEKGLSGWSQRSNAQFFYAILQKLQKQGASEELILQVMQKASNSAGFSNVLVAHKIIERGEKSPSSGEDLLAQFAL